MLYLSFRFFNIDGNLYGSLIHFTSYQQPLVLRSMQIIEQQSCFLNQISTLNDLNFVFHWLGRALSTELPAVVLPMLLLFECLTDFNLRVSSLFQPLLDCLLISIVFQYWLPKSFWFWCFISPYNFSYQCALFASFSAWSSIVASALTLSITFFCFT